MKLLISTFFTMLIIGFAGRSHGQDIETIRYKDGSYVGEMKGYLKHGQGTLIRGNVTYTGEFRDNLYHGDGTLTDSSGKRISGTWDKGSLIKPNGNLLTDREKYLERMKNQLNERNLEEQRQSTQAEKPSYTISANETKKLQEQCISFGFRVDTDDMANCILQLYLKSEVDSEAMTTKKAIEDQVRNNRLQAERLAEQQRQQQEYAREQARIRNADLAEQKRQQEDQKRQRAARALYNLGMDIANPKRGNSTEPITRRVKNCVLSSDPFGRVYTFSGIACPSGYMPH